MDYLDLFGGNNDNRHAPLAYRMRPKTLQDIVGQEEILGEGKLLKRAIASDRLGSIILYGPPGVGKTTIAEVIALSTKSEFIRLNAVTSGVQDIRNVVEKAKNNLKIDNTKTILFVDEIHRFNRAQQDVLLPYVENGTLTLIGATTQNPYFEINAPLLSRSRVFKLNPLEKKDILSLLRRAIDDSEQGLKNMNVSIDDEALDHIAEFANGDARNSLNALELAALSTTPDANGRVHVTLDVACESIQRRALLYNDGGDSHYDVISAYIKSMRGSNPDAALYYLARMLEAGEDPMFIARRLVILASEDVGMADSQALVVAVAAQKAFEAVGLPEGRLHLAHATVYLATAPKSNSSCIALNRAIDDVKNKSSFQVPLHLKSSNYTGADSLGHGVGYLYPHDYENAEVEQDYLPNELKGTVYYMPTIRDKIADKHRKK